MGLHSWALTWLTWAKRELRVLKLVVRDARTPRTAKWMLGFAVAYLAMPFDIIPDFIPVLGQLDDLLIVPALISLAIKLVPDAVIADCRLREAQSNSN